MSKYKYQKEFLFSTKKLQDIQLFLQNQQTPLDLLLIRDNKKNTAIHHCSYLNQHRHIEFYIKYYRRNLENEGYTFNEIKSRTKLLLNQKNAEGLTAAHYAAFKGNITVLKSLQKYEGDLSIVSDLGMNLLHFAAQGDKINTVLFLHQRQFDINAKDLKRSTPLHWASYSGSEKIVEYLLAQEEIMIDEEDLDGHTPLHISVAYGYSKIVKKLLIAGADRRRKNAKGQTAFEIARVNEFDKIGKMLDDRYSFLDYLKFICNAKMRYQPKERSYLQPILYYCLSVIMLALSLAVIDIKITWIYITQAVIFGCSIILFTTLIIPPKKPIEHHDYTFFCEREQINRLCMVCLHPMRTREYHCSTCRICIGQYDHHCFWINNCVGKNNIIRFNIFLVLTEISLVWLGYLAITVIVLIIQGNTNSSIFNINPFIKDSHLQVLVLIISFLICLVVLLLAVPMFCLILIQQKNLLLGKTSYQRFSKSNESILTRQGSDFLTRSWEGSNPPSCNNCVGMCYESQEEDKSSESNSTSSSFVREH